MGISREEMKMKKENRNKTENNNPIMICFDREPERIRNGTEYYDGPCIVHVCLDGENGGGFNKDGIEVVWETDTQSENAIERKEANRWEANWWTYQKETGMYVKDYLADQDGTYRCVLTYTDQGGHMVRQEETPFVVDQTAPKISAETIKTESGNAHTILVEVEEYSFSREQTHIYGKKNVNGDETWQEMDTSWFLIGEKALTQVKIDRKEMDEFWVKAEDLAGNQAEYHQKVEAEPSGQREDASGMFFAALTVLACFFLLTLFTGVRKIFP